MERLSDEGRTRERGGICGGEGIIPHYFQSADFGGNHDWLESRYGSEMRLVSNQALAVCLIPVQTFEDLLPLHNLTT
jgi:hypothetical protein